MILVQLILTILIHVFIRRTRDKITTNETAAMESNVSYAVAAVSVTETDSTTIRCAELTAFLNVQREIINDIDVKFFLNELCKVQIIQPIDVMRIAKLMGDPKLLETRRDVLIKQAKALFDLLTSSQDLAMRSYTPFLELLRRDNLYPWVAERLQAEYVAATEILERNSQASHINNNVATALDRMNVEPTPGSHRLPANGNAVGHNTQAGPSNGNVKPTQSSVDPYNTYEPEYRSIHPAGASARVRPFTSNSGRQSQSPRTTRSQVASLADTQYAAVHLFQQFAIEHAESSDMEEEIQATANQYRPQPEVLYVFCLSVIILQRITILIFYLDFISRVPNQMLARMGADLKRIAEQFERSPERHRVRERAQQLDLNNINYESFSCLLNAMFADGVTKAGIVTLFFFCCDLMSRAAHSGGLTMLSRVLQWSFKYILDQLCRWVAERGGWVTVFGEYVKNFLLSAAAVSIIMASVTYMTNTWGSQ